jgi:transposase
MRYTTFRFALAPTSGQAAVLARHAGASRFAYNQSLRLVMDALAARQTDPSATVPWSGFDLINAFNAWKRGERAGRRFAVASDGTITKQVTGLPWRHQVCAQVFEEAAVDLGRALAAHAEGGNRQVGFPKPKRKGRCRDSFRLRNKKSWDGDDLIRLGEGHPRSVTLPKIGIILVHDDTRRLRRLLRSVEQLDPTTGRRMVVPRARILFANLIRNRYLGRAMADAGWAELARLLAYKTAWFGGELVVCDRWFASTRTCSACGGRKPEMSLAERIFSCAACGLVMDRDRNAAANLAVWAEIATMATARAPDRQAGGRVTTPLEGKALAVAEATAKPAPMKGEPTLQRLPEPRAPEKGGAGRPHHGCQTRLSDNQSGSSDPGP